MSGIKRVRRRIETNLTKAMAGMKPTYDEIVALRAEVRMRRAQWLPKHWPTGNLVRVPLAEIAWPHLEGRMATITGYSEEGRVLVQFEGETLHEWSTEFLERVH